VIAREFLDCGRLVDRQDGVARVRLVVESQHAAVGQGEALEAQLRGNLRARRRLPRDECAGDTLGRGACGEQLEQWVSRPLLLSSGREAKARRVLLARGQLCGKV
jgi:hypothetical protein